MSYQHPEMDILHMADMVEDIHSVTNLMGKCTYLTSLRQFDRRQTVIYYIKCTVSMQVCS